MKRTHREIDRLAAILLFVRSENECYVNDPTELNTLVRAYDEYGLSSIECHCFCNLNAFLDCCQGVNNHLAACPGKMTGHLSSFSREFMMVMLPHTPMPYPVTPFTPKLPTPTISESSSASGAVPPPNFVGKVEQELEPSAGACAHQHVERTIRVYLVDDHQMLLDCLSAYLKADSQFEVVGQATNTDQALLEITQNLPDVVVMDVELPGRSVFDIAETLRSRVHGIRIIYLSGFASDILLTRALKPGCYGYLLKGEPVSVIRQAILRAMDGEMSFSPDVRQRLAVDSVSRRFSVSSDSPLTALTGRQLEVLRHLANGASVKEIARLMHLSQKSVDSHKYRIMHKLGIHDRVELARFAIREGLIRP